MAMHSSYMRAGQGQAGGGAPSGLVPASPDEMHGFLKDKQAWEHAISLYQGPDPLDHWYNYICWYENHANSDPELKYRETLERCLTVYEHNDYYRQDARLVRLWLKYIAMQTDQLHFYQVLFQRGTGRQVAAFYIGWAGYYESREEFKDAEAVFNLAFQEKAQTHAELQHAHSKFNYARSVYFQRQQQQQHLQQQQQQQILQQPDALQQLANYTQQLPQSYNQQQRPPTHSQPYQHHPQQQQQQHPQQHLQQQQQDQLPSQHIYQQYHHHQQQPQPQHHHHQPVSYHHYTETTPANPPPQNHYPNQAAYAPPMPGASQQTHYESQQPQQEQKQEVEQPQQNQNQMTPTMATATATTTVPVVASAPAAAATPSPSSATHNGNGHVEAPAPAAMSEVAGLRLPRNFYAYGRNNHETWKPALTLEEPDDPSRICHYAKQLVYPPGLGIEYSPEELLARKYKQKMEERTKRQQQHQQQEQSSDQQQEQTLYNSYNSSENSYYMTAVDGALYGNQNTSSELETKLGQQNEDEGDEEDDQDDGEEDGESEEGEEEEGSEEATDEEDEDEDEEEEEETTNGIQFSAQTTFEQSNRSIKIKFKKERTLESSSSAYSAYTIENVYQQREQITHTPTPMPIAIPSTATAAVAVAPPPVPAPQPNVSPIPLANQQRQRNGHHFHPYLLGQTSTPKSEPNGYRRIRTKAKRNKFQADLCSNSNSSSSATAANDMAGSGATAMAHGHAHAASFNDNANFSFSSATALDNSNSSLALAVDRLNFRDSSQIVGNQSQAIPNQSNTVTPAPVNKTLQAISNNNNNNNNNGADFSTFQENSYFATQHDSEAQERRLSKALETIERHLAKEAIDPFNSELCRAFLAKLNFPGTNEDDEQSTYKIVQTPLPKISNTRTLNVLEGSVQFNIDKEVGRGSYGSVYKATDTRTGNVVALKYQKPPNTWEIYICDQVLKRITDPDILPGLMDISTAIIAPNASLIATEFSPFGSLLDINNKIRQATTKVMHESLVMHFSGQICNIVDYLHRQHIIHADIKPDNFLLMRVPNVDSPLPSLRLIDFGCAIDMTLFPDAEHTKFRKVIHTDGFTCIEMQESRPWSYETDLFCIAGTVHVMLFGEYMQPQKRGPTWDIRQKLPRYLKKHVWSKFFGELLNMQADKLPQLHQMRIIFEEECLGMDSELQKQIRTLSNILHRR